MGVCMPVLSRKGIHHCSALQFELQSTDGGSAGLYCMSCLIWLADLREFDALELTEDMIAEFMDMSCPPTPSPSVRCPD
jgi:hypothetical protein